MNIHATRSFTLRLGVAAAGLVLGACVHRAAESPAVVATAAAPASEPSAAATQPAASGDPATLRERMRVIAKTHCGTCHQSTLPTAKPAALAIHDLDSPDWPATLSRAQLERGFTRRLNARLGAEDLSLLRAFVAAEAAKR